MVLAPAPPLFTGLDAPDIEIVDSPIDSDNAHALLDLSRGGRIQILRPIDESPTRRFVAVVPLDLEGFDRIEAIQRLLASLHGRAIPPDTRLTRQQRARLARALRALDGRRTGATQREIAEVLFRIGSLDRHSWQASSARYAVMSLLREARAMVSGGYRRLLRHRHGS